MKFTTDFVKAFFILLRAFVPIWGGIAVLVTLLGVILARLEGLPLGDGLYFAWVTATTVGYGDIAPTTGTTQFLAICIAILGILLTGILVSIALSAAKLSIQKNGSLDSLSKTKQQRIAESAAKRDQRK